MAPRKKGKKVSVADALLKQYHNPAAPGSLGGVQRFAKAYGVPQKTAQNVLKKRFSLHFTQTTTTTISNHSCSGWRIG